MMLRNPRDADIDIVKSVSSLGRLSKASVLYVRRSSGRFSGTMGKEFRKYFSKIYDF